MNRGPSIVSLTHHLAATPAEFLLPAHQVVVAAVVMDLLRQLHGQEPSSSLFKRFVSTDPARRNWQQLMLIACWLLSNPWFVANPPSVALITDWLQVGVAKLAELVKAERFVQTEEHREELARLCLKAFALLPEGETDFQAQDRLETVSTLERQRVKAEALRVREESRKRREELAKAQEEKARLLREEMERKAAASGAAKVSRD